MITDPDPNDLLCVSIICQGLLASGHFTYEGDSEDDPGVSAYRIEHWKQDGLPRGYGLFVVDSALQVLHLLKAELREQEAVDKAKAEKAEQLT